MQTGSGRCFWEPGRSKWSLRSFEAFSGNHGHSQRPMEVGPSEAQRPIEVVVMTTKLVSPEHIVYQVNSREELKELVRRLRIDEKLAGNLRQLCGWQQVGDDHSGRGRASGWTLLHLVRWLRREGMDTYIVAIGSAPQIRNAVPGLKEVTNSDDHVKKLLNDAMCRRRSGAQSARSTFARSCASRRGITSIAASGVNWWSSIARRCRRKRWGCQPRSPSRRLWAG